MKSVKKKIPKSQSISPTNASLLSALSEQFASSLTYVYINSLQREVPFREITVLEQKTISKLLIANEDRQDIMYNAQVALLQKICKDETVIIENLTEFDRIKIMLEIYQNNFFKSNTDAQCPNCNETINVTLDFQTVVDNLNKINLSDIILTDEIQTHNIKYILNFPSVKRIQDYRSYIYESSYDTKNIELTYNIDMVDLFIKKLILTNKLTNDVIELNAEDYSYAEYTKYLEILPQSVIYNSENLLTTIKNEIFDKIQECFPKILCHNCNTNIEIFNGLESFFTL